MLLIRKRIKDNSFVGFDLLTSKLAIYLTVHNNHACIFYNTACFSNNKTVALSLRAEVQDTSNCIQSINSIQPCIVILIMGKS